MSQLLIKTGTVPNDRTGDSLFAAFNKVNANFTELYTITGGSTADLKELIQDTIAEMIANGTLFGLTATYDDPTNALDLHVTDAILDGGVASIMFDELQFDGGNASTETFTDMLINGGAA